ncbi:CLUMA_CG010807, isoform A [Clunio marinus]|uniref:CLUMA_CG010807, isoform A n=1 Tax=Clunio marinus TaxID=568069 RepID=A0A1J1ICD8_9DIPT|nr:CLUMA_CG010807, isoform A [Clunio marinus]
MSWLEESIMISFLFKGTTTSTCFYLLRKFLILHSNPTKGKEFYCAKKERNSETARENCCGLAATFTCCLSRCLSRYCEANESNSDMTTEMFKEFIHLGLEHIIYDEQK